MAPRPFWRGYLKLSLVTAAVTLTPATSESRKVRFHTLNRKTGDRIFSRYLDATTGREVDDEDQVKGYEKAENDYVMLKEDELEAVQLESTRTIDIEMFVPADSVEWVYYDSPYFLAPSDEVGEEPFAVVREAMVATGTVGIARLVLSGRERAVMIEPRDAGMVLWTLRFGDEVRDETSYFKGLDEEPDAKALKMVAALIAARTTSWSPKLVEDPVQDKLLALIKARQKGKRKPTPARTGAGEEPAAPSNVVDLMAALRKSLGDKPGERKRKS